MAIRFQCKRCESSQIGKDAWAEWNEELQEWELLVVYDHMECLNCGAMGNDIEEVQISEH